MAGYSFMNSFAISSISGALGPSMACQKSIVFCAAAPRESTPTKNRVAAEDSRWRKLIIMISFSTFNAGHRHAAYEVALQGEKYQERRHDDQRRRHHQELPFPRAFPFHKKTQADGQRPHLVGV